MSVTAETPYKKGKRKEKRKDVRAVQVTVNKVSDTSGTVWVAPCKQYCL